MKYALVKQVCFDGCTSPDEILAIGLPIKELRLKWNTHVKDTPCNKLPLMGDNEFTCSMAYTGGGCYAEHTILIREWKDLI